MSIAIRTRHLTKRFPLSKTSLWHLWLGRKRRMPSFAALSNVNIEVPEGEMLGVLGANGAGKSTLLRTLGGIYHADEGSVKLRGDFVGLFELGGMGNYHMTGRQYVRRHLQMHNVPKAERAAIIEDVHEFSELGTYFDQRIRTYSAGMSARLYFAVATSVHKKIYLIDEILSVGDEHFQVKSWARMRERIVQGMSGILVTHDWSAVVKLCRRAAILDKGVITHEGEADKTVATYLRLPASESSEARVIAPSLIEVKSGGPLLIECELELDTDMAVELSASVEYLMLGVGWEIVLLQDYAPVASKKGRYRVRITSPQTPLSPGDYFLNLFVATAPDALGTRRVLQTFSWTYDNGLTLRVTGEKRADLAPFPIRWTQVAA